MGTLFAAIVLAGPWVQSPHFPQAKQEAALNATLRLTNPATRGEGTAVRIGTLGPHVYYLTAKHNLKDTMVVDLESFSAATFPKVLQKIPQAAVAKEWPDIDLALLRAVEPNPPGFLRVKSQPSNAKANSPVLTLGCSDLTTPSLETDEIDGAKLVKKPGQSESQWHWVTKKQPIEGRSGGPLVSVSGDLIGICSGTDSETKKGYYVHESAIRDALKAAGCDQLMVPPAQPLHREK